MANIYEGMNVRQKLAKARLQFLNQKVKKSGKNMHLEFKYFELRTLYLPAIRIFARVGLTTDIDFTDENQGYYCLPQWFLPGESRSQILFHCCSHDAGIVIDIPSTATHIVPCR